MYVPAGTVVEPNTRALSVTNVVAALAPVRHQSSYGMSLPITWRPRFDGRP